MTELLLDIKPLSWLGILCAALSGAIVGCERQVMGKPVGIRTSMLICLGTYAFVTVSNSVAGEHADLSRVIGQVITGIGFLGAGVMISRDGLVFGVTSAAAIWLLAAVGVTIASSYYLTGIKLAVMAVIILIGVDVVEHFFVTMQKGVHSKLRRRGN